MLPQNQKKQFFRQPGKPPCTCPSHIEALAELHYTNPEMPKVVTKEQSQHHPGKGGLSASTNILAKGCVKLKQNRLEAFESVKERTICLSFWESFIFSRGLAFSNMSSTKNGTSLENVWHPSVKNRRISPTVASLVPALKPHVWATLATFNTSSPVRLAWGIFYWEMVGRGFVDHVFWGPGTTLASESNNVDFHLNLQHVFSGSKS